jgi:adenosylcobinamide kinase/adenosylcobinamide-phosphate guanylyltransferase
VGEDRLRRAVLTGSAAQRWPVAGCRCPCCALAGGGIAPEGGSSADFPAGSSVWGSPSGLLVSGLFTVDGDPNGHDGSLPKLVTARPPAGAPSGVRWLAVGERLEFDGVRVAALPAGTAEGEPDPDRVVLVLGQGSQTLLWASGSGPLPAVTLEALQGAELTAAVLDAGAPVDAQTPDGAAPEAMDATGLAPAHTVALLRRVGALADGCLLVVAGLGHAGPAPRRFAGLVATWGGHLLSDGTGLWPDRQADGRQADEGDRATAPGRPQFPHRQQRASSLPPRTVVLGAAASGKSRVAELLLAAQPEVVYVATGPQPEAADAAWATRVAVHRRRRPPWWRTVEGGDLAALLTHPGPPLLVDSLGTWLTGTMTDVGCWDDRPGWQERLQQRADALVAAWRQSARPVVAVIEEVGWGVVPSTVSGGHFRDTLGRLSRQVGDRSERVLLVVAGRPVDLDAVGGAVGRFPGSTATTGAATAWEGLG